jgi:beta-lactamase class A
LGVGVAAIAGTLLSVFSPSNVPAGNGETTTATAPRRGNASTLPGQGAVTITAIQPSSELTRLKAQLDQLATLTPGLTPAVYAFDIDSGRYVDLNGTEAVAAASTIKVPILVAFLQQVDAGNLALNQAVVLQEQHLAGGSGSLASEAIGSEYTALEVATRMIIHSDNTATNMMIEALGGQEVLNQQFATWGLESTVLRNPLPDLEGTNTTSTRDLALLMALVDQGDVLSRRSRERLFSIMQRTVNRSLIAFSLTDGSLVANKTGDIALALGDVAMVDTPNGNRYALAIMVQRPNNDGRASELIRRITEAVHKELNQPIAPVGRPLAPGEAAPAGESLNPDETVSPEESLDAPATDDSVNSEEFPVPGDSVTPEGAVDPEASPTSPSSGPEASPSTPPTGDQTPPG